MRRNKPPVRFTGQHFTIDKSLIADAIELAEIKESHLVLDIGAGKGFLTLDLASRHPHIIVIENDLTLVGILRRRFSRDPHVKIIGTDFRSYAIPQTSFKVVSNIPFGIIAHILKALMFDNVEYFMGGSLIMQLEPARKLIANQALNPYKVFYRTFFDLTLMYEVMPQSFMPPPTVKSALLKIGRKRLVVDREMKGKYLDFLFLMLQKPRLPVRTSLKRLFRKTQVREISGRYGINPAHPVVGLSPGQWWRCFLEMLETVPERFHPGR